MARKRQLDPEYPFEQEIAQLSIPARYFYILSWCHMDDANGVLPYNAYKLKGQIFPEDGIDIEKLIQELINMRRLFPFEAEGKKWLWCPTLLKHQVINHPSKRKYPDPPNTLKEDYRSGKLALTQSRVELSRVEIKIKEQPSAALKAVLDKVFKDGFNIYTLINKVKKQLKWSKTKDFPEEVLLKVANRYFKEKAIIKEPWPWFVKTLEMESGAYSAKQNIKKSDEFKNDTRSLKEILMAAMPKDVLVKSAIPGQEKEK